MSGFYFLVIVTIISAIVSLGFSLNAVADRKQNQKSQTNALYANIAIITRCKKPVMNGP